MIDLTNVTQLLISCKNPLRIRNTDKIREDKIRVDIDKRFVTKIRGLLC